MSEKIYIMSWYDNDLDDGELPRAYFPHTGQFEWCFDHWYRIEFEDGGVGWWPDGDNVPERIFRDWDFRGDNLDVSVVNAL